jgi:hypothetical protein
MNIPKFGRRSTRSPALARDLKTRLADADERVSDAVVVARARATTLIGRMRETLQATQAGANGTTTALQSLPDSTLRWMAASSIGLGAGFYLTGAPRLVIVAGIAPALVMGAAIALRPIEPVDTTHAIA